MNHTPREKFLLLVVPAFAVMAVYLWFVRGKTPDELNRSQKALQAARQAAPDPMMVQAQEARLGMLRVEMRKLEQRKREIATRWDTAVQAATRVTTRAERAEKLNAVLTRHGLLLIDSRPSDANKEGRMPDSLSRLAQTFGPAQQPQLWSYQLEGTYLDLLQAMEDLAGSSELLALPVGVKMKESEGPGSVREWTLQVWM